MSYVSPDEAREVYLYEMWGKDEDGQPVVEYQAVDFAAEARQFPVGPSPGAVCGAPTQRGNCPGRPVAGGNGRCVWHGGASKNAPRSFKIEPMENVEIPAVVANGVKIEGEQTDPLGSFGYVSYKVTFAAPSLLYAPKADGLYDMSDAEVEGVVEEIITGKADPDPWVWEDV